ncbi:MAG: DUF5678 domain-containing protein [Candidatus Helarchaeota archaeon]
MTQLNFILDEEKKQRIKELIESKKYKSISDFIRSAIIERLKIEETSGLKNKNIVIPDWIPDGKFVAIVRGAIVAVGDTAVEVTRESVAKFPDGSWVIKRKGKSVKIPEYIYGTYMVLFSCNGVDQVHHWE